MNGAFDPGAEEVPVLCGRAVVLRRGQALDAWLRARGKEASGAFLVLETLCADGPSAAGLVTALLEAGVEAVVAEAIPPAFCRAAAAAGLPALVVDRTAGIRDGDRLRIDVEVHRIANLSSGDRCIVRNLYDGALDELRAARRGDG